MYRFQQEINNVSACCGRYLSDEAIEWIKENYPVAQPVELYRGFTIQSEDAGGIDNYDDLNAVCRAWLGAPCEAIVEGAQLIYQTPVSMSWSHDPSVAMNFLCPRAGGNLNSDYNECLAKIMIKATIPADKIVVDMTMLPNEYQGYYPFQKEVIVDFGVFHVEVQWASIKEWNGASWGAIRDHNIGKLG